MNNQHAEARLTRIGVIGATGYVGQELVRLICMHPYLRLTVACSVSFTGQKYSEVVPAARGICDLVLEEVDIDRMAEECDVVITALPHGVSATMVPGLLEKGLKVLDHSGDFRFRDPALYEAAYKMPAPEQNYLDMAVYGLPELYRDELATTRLISNPGCYPTCTILGFLPLLRAGYLQLDSLIADIYSGVSGAGRKADLATSYCETESNLKPYGVLGHRHRIEMISRLEEIGAPGIKLSFTPHLAPVKRAMLASLYARPTGLFPESLQDTTALTAFYADCYADDPFVRVLPAGQLPQTKDVQYSNFIDIAAVYEPESNWLRVFTAQDNLGKGAASQAIQALNCMLDYDERTGIWFSGIHV